MAKDPVHPLAANTSRFKVVKHFSGERFIPCEYGEIWCANATTIAAVVEGHHPRVLKRLLVMGGQRRGFGDEAHILLFPISRVNDVAETMRAAKQKGTTPELTAHLRAIGFKSKAK